MQDPIGSFIRIRDHYIKYLDTAFRIADPDVEAERQALLRRPGDLATEPLLEPLPLYVGGGTRLEDLVDDTPGSEFLPGFAQDERKAFVELCLGGLFGSSLAASYNGVSRTSDYAPFSHQMKMLVRGVSDGLPGIVTSGTGSGKTEAFLLPVLASIVREAKKHWPEAPSGYLKSRWWNGRTKGFASPERPLINPWVPKREGEPESRPSAVRALILYPMNALVEDQLVRLRKALDSREARVALDNQLGGNRIFFGRYTGNTPSTWTRGDAGLGYLQALAPEERSGTPAAHQAGQFGRELEKILEHDAKKRRSRQERNRDALRDAERIQNAARALALEKHSSHPDEYRARVADATYGVNDPASAFGFEAPFMFPATDGAEMITRWDMQEYPPDILVTNTSMLSGMLAREDDAPIFDLTRAWIEGNDDARFHLVLDELHLQRGSAGTEVSYLLRLLIHRLGLNTPKNRHKLRILASSASLPTAGEDGEKSAAFLWDFFAANGLPDECVGDDEGRHLWRESIQAGDPLRPVTGRIATKVASTPFLELLDELLRDSTEDQITVRVPETGSTAAAKWFDVAHELGWTGTNILDAMAVAATEAGALAASACARQLESDPGAVELRARRVSEVVSSVFTNPGSNYEERLREARALTLVRGALELDEVKHAANRLTEENRSVPSFRVHTFFRALEGLYAPLDPLPKPYSKDTGERFEPIGQLSVEATSRASSRRGLHGALRRFELLYCEACGDLFVGGPTPSRQQGMVVTAGEAEAETEILPFEPNLDGLPDAAASQRFEENTYDSFALFWPSDRLSEGDRGNQSVGYWTEATLDRRTGGIYRGGAPSLASEDAVRGYLYKRRSGGNDKKGRSSYDPGSHVPFACPNCETDYRGRQDDGMRLSPIRNFRAGFGKSTQLFASELFDALKSAEGEDEARLVSFSDSRQDAARAALDIERRHNQDLRRQLVVGRSRDLLARLDAAELRRTLAEMEGEWPTASTLRRQRINREIDAIESMLWMAKNRAVPLARLLASHEGLGDPSASLPPLLEEVAKRGLHPFDDAGIAKIKGRPSVDEGTMPVEHEWTDLVDVGDWQSPKWVSASQTDDIYYGQQELVRQVLARYTDVLFNKTYYALEETGLAYISVDRRNRTTEEEMEPDVVGRLNAVVRILTDAYRYEPFPMTRSRDLRDWRDLEDVRSPRVRKLVTTLLSESARVEWADAMKALGQLGHHSGVVRVEDLVIQLVEEDDPYWRCPKCARVHLYPGLGACTRCGATFREKSSGTTAELRKRGFLGNRIERSASSVYALKCEELTGQTSDPASRQRRFLDVFFDEREKALERIDLLAVTTTMEVGIDIGPLQAVLQANMPPQRFNYQQRVGRAGRRGQAFSIAVTICRSKNHDLHYFRHPEQITGDPPPVPFLTTSMPSIAARLVNKAWLIAAFRRMREDYRADWRLFPGDVMSLSAPDIHGEFLTVHDAMDSGIQLDIQRYLEETEHEARLFADQVQVGVEAPRSVDPKTLLRQISETCETSRVDLGLGQALAEHGFMPMYGMPTRTRSLYTQILDEKEGNGKLDSIERDLEVSIYEFAPGHKIVRDKREHLPVGFTPTLFLPPRRSRGRGEVTLARPLQPSPFTEHFRLLACPTCGAWQKLEPGEAPPELCEACESPLVNGEPVVCVVPNAYRTDLWPSGEKPEAKSRTYRSIQAEGRALHLRPMKSTRSRADVYFDNQAMTYRLNRGRPDENGSYGFPVKYGSQRTQGYAFPNQAIDTAFTSSEATSRRFGVRLQTTSDDRVADRPDSVWLAAPKTTDSLFVAPSSVYEGLALRRLPARSDRVAAYDVFRWQGVRAAAVSATFMIAEQAASYFDIDPDELEVLEPRVTGSTKTPTLQLSDALLNGAGFARELARDRDGGPLVFELIERILDAGPKSIAASYDEDDHRQECLSSCYRCLQRYGNQSYHGILDWRLGLAYLRAITNPDYTVGLRLDDEEEGSSGMTDWKEVADLLATEAANRFGNGNVIREVDGVPIVELSLEGVTVFVVVTHPLWETEDVPRLRGRMKQAYEVAKAKVAGAGRQATARSWDTFNLERRMVQVRARMLEDVLA